MRNLRILDRVVFAARPLFEKGQNNHEVARALRVSVATVYRARKAAGIPQKPAGRPRTTA